MGRAPGAEWLLELQRLAGNRAVSRLVAQRDAAGVDAPPDHPSAKSLERATTAVPAPR
jgi:hypothetical protein